MLNYLSVLVALQRSEPTAKPKLLIVWREPCFIADGRHLDSANDERMIDSIGEHRAQPCRRKYIRGNYEMTGIFRAAEREQIGEISRWIADLPRAIYMV